MPTGEGQINQKGIVWYSTLVDKLLAAGITPYASNVIAARSTGPAPGGWVAWRSTRTRLPIGSGC